MAALGRRVDHAVDRRGQPVVGQPFEHIADIDHQRALRRHDRQPAAVAHQQLEPRFLGAEQQRDQINIAVRARANALGVARDRRIMEQPHHRIAVLHCAVEPVRREAEMLRNRAEQLIARAVERGVKRGEGLAKACDLGGPDIIGHMVAKAVPRRQIAPDMPELLEIMEIGILGNLGPERRIAARAREFGAEIAALDRLGQREQLLRQLPAARDQIGVDPMIDNHRKAIGLKALAERLRKAGSIMRGAGERKRGNLIGHNRHTYAVLTRVSR